MDKNLDNANTAEAVKTTPEIIVKGNPDVWQLVCKASGKNWMKSTKKMVVYAPTHIIQVTTEFRDDQGNVTACAEAISGPIPGVGPDTV